MTTDDTPAAGLLALLDDAALEAIRLQLAASIPVGTKTQRVKAKAFAAGVAHAVAGLRAQANPSTTRSDK